MRLTTHHSCDRSFLFPSATLNLLVRLQHPWIHRGLGPEQKSIGHSGNESRQGVRINLMWIEKWVWLWIFPDKASPWEQKWKSVLFTTVFPGPAPHTALKEPSRYISNLFRELSARRAGQGRGSHLRAISWYESMRMHPTCWQYTCSVEIFGISRMNTFSVLWEREHFIFSQENSKSMWSENRKMSRSSRRIDVAFSRSPGLPSSLFPFTYEPCRVVPENVFPVFPAGTGLVSIISGLLLLILSSLKSPSPCSDLASKSGPGELHKSMYSHVLSWQKCFRTSPCSLRRIF